MISTPNAPSGSWDIAAARRIAATEEQQRVVDKALVAHFARERITREAGRWLTAETAHEAFIVWQYATFKAIDRRTEVFYMFALACKPLPLFYPEASIPHINEEGELIYIIEPAFKNTVLKDACHDDHH